MSSDSRTTPAVDVGAPRKCGSRALVAALAMLSGALASRDWCGVSPEFRATVGERNGTNEALLSAAEERNEPWWMSCGFDLPDSMLKYAEEWDEELMVLLFILALPLVLTLNHLMSAIYGAHRDMDSWKTWTQSEILDKRRTATCC